MSKQLLLKLLIPLAAVIIITSAFLLKRQSAPTPDHWPRQASGTGAGHIAFVANEVCAECHEAEYEKWIGSDHDLAMQSATKKTVLGDFSSVTFESQGVTSRFFRKGGKFFVNTEGPDGLLRDYEIKYTFGVTPLQQYLIEFPGGRLQCLTIAWDTQAKRWFSLYPDERIEPGDPLHWTGVMQNWNHMCAECHSTNLRKNYDAASDSYHTEWDEIDVSCQACHGPGAEHVAWAETLPKNYEYTENTNVHLVVDFKNTIRNNIDACIRCHSLRSPVSVDNSHDRSFTDDYLLTPLHEGIYHADGQILGEVYVAGSFSQSKMYHSAVRCNHCHNPHSLKLLRPGNYVCLQCHSLNPLEAFSFLEKKDYNNKKHHFHEPGTAGSNCVDCHMIQRNFMVVDPRRDHSFRIPRPDLTVKLGVPNACNDCHQDKSPEWSLEQVTAWYGPETYEKPHFAEAIAAGRESRPEGQRLLLGLITDPNQPAVVRATALELIRQYDSDAVRQAIRTSLKDTAPMVRAYAAAGLERFDLIAWRDEAVALLEDPSRAVRTEAARILTFLPRDLIPQATRAEFQENLQAYLQTQQAGADRPEGNMNLAILYENLGQWDKAEQAYLKAIRQNRTFLPAHVNLATYYSAVGRENEAEQLLLRMLKPYPDNGELYYSLGLLLGQQQRYQDAATYLQEATRHLPEQPNVWYNYGLALQQLRRLDEAEIPLLRAYNLDKNDVETVYALSVLYVQREDWKIAASYVKQLAAMEPQSQRTLSLRKFIDNQVQP